MENLRENQDNNNSCVILNYKELENVSYEERFGKKLEKNLFNSEEIIQICFKFLLLELTIRKFF